MESLNPTIWQTCRVLSNENRLRLLWKLFQVEESNVSRLGDSIGLSEPVASSYLRALNARGLIHAERRKNYVYYRPEANPEVAHAERLLTALKDCYDNFMPLKLVAYQMTAFTHQRRMDIIRVLNDVECEEVQLSAKSGISPQALYRHIRKLVARGYVEKDGAMIRLIPQEGILSKELVAMVLGL